MLRAAVSLGLVVAVGVSAVEPAAGHADLVASCPGAGEVISGIAQIELGFSGPMLIRPDTPARIVIVGVDGQAVAEAVPVLKSATVVEAQVPGLAPGAYEVAYELFSFDGDLNIGSFEFSVGAAEDATNCAAADEPEANAGAPWPLIGLGAVTVAGLGIAGWLWFRRRPASG